jgi:hypothetical protein
VLLIAGWTGLRWSELREVRVRDFVQVPMPVILWHPVVDSTTSATKPRVCGSPEESIR